MTAMPAAVTSGDVDPSFRPSTELELIQAQMSWRWRMFSGQLYKIMVKGDDDATGQEQQFVLPFVPNVSQVVLLNSLHNMNLILKARQLGFTTAIDLFLTDMALYLPNQRIGIIAHQKEDVMTIFRDKVQFAYENLPDVLRMFMPVKTQTKTEYLFAHNQSSIRVAMSMRSGTIHGLHVSEMGKLAAKYPGKASEVVTGSLPTVPSTGIVFIESTAEGQSGEFYKLAQQAEQTAQLKKPHELTQDDWRFFFFAWWQEPKYQRNPKGVTISPEDHDYFDLIELEMNTLLTNRQRAWYIGQRDGKFSGDQAKMWREFPSKPSECWQQSTEGKYYPKELAAARVQNRIRSVPYIKDIPVHTFWDIGSSDGTGIWLMQIVGEEHHFLRYIENWLESYSFYISELQATGYLFGNHFIPHDGEHVRQGQNRVAAPIEMLEELAPSWNFVTVPRVQVLQHRIDATRKHFPRAHFDAEGCKAGLIHMANYQKSWSSIIGGYIDTPLKNDATEAADSFGQWAQAMEAGAFGSTKPRTRKNRPGGLAA